MKLDRKDKQVLMHLRDHCMAVQDDVQFIGTITALERDTRTQRSLAFSVLQIGELVNNELSMEFRASHTEIPWQVIVAMRHKLVHHYADRKLDIIWDTATKSIPGLVSFIDNILKDSESPGGLNLRKTR